MEPCGRAWPMSGLFICVSCRITPFMGGPLKLGQLLLIFIFLLLGGSVQPFNGTGLKFWVLKQKQDARKIFTCQIISFLMTSPKIFREVFKRLEEIKRNFSLDNFDYRGEEWELCLFPLVSFWQQSIKALNTLLLKTQGPTQVSHFQNNRPSFKGTVHPKLEKYFILYSCCSRHMSSYFLSGCRLGRLLLY